MAAKVEKLDVLRWHLDFINLEIGELSHGERLKWITEAIYIVAFGVPRLQVHAYLGDKLPTTKKISQWNKGTRLEDCQLLLKGSFDALMTKIQQNVDVIDGKAPKKKFFATFANFETSTKTLVQFRHHPPSDLDTFFKMKLHTILRAEKDENTLLQSLYQALDGVQIGSLRVCDECGNYFLHTSKKEKIFCTNKCAARKASRDRRERIKNDPKKHAEELKKAAIRARKSYVKRTPRGKPARRPYKHKDSTEK